MDLSRLTRRDHWNNTNISINERYIEASVGFYSKSKIKNYPNYRRTFSRKEGRDNDPR